MFKADSRAMQGISVAYRKAVGEMGGLTTLNFNTLSPVGEPGGQGKVG